MNRFFNLDAALLFLRVTASALVLFVLGLSKAIHFTSSSTRSRTRCIWARH
jgi:putative oxidoreductase